MAHLDDVTKDRARVRIRCGAIPTDQHVMIQAADGGDWLDVSHVVSGIEFSTKPGELSQVWLKVLLVDVEVEGEIRGIVGKRIYVEREEAGA